MNFKLLFLFLLSVVLVTSCSKTDEPLKEAHISGTITVDDQIDASGDHSGIQLLSTVQNDDRTDTLFFAQTDIDGSFSGTASFIQADIYPVLITRNRNTFGYLNVIFAEEDTIHITGMLPEISETTEISSKENDVFEVYERVDRSFSRVANYINAGSMSADSIRAEIEKWSDIYWEVFEEYPVSYAGRLSAESSVSILSGWNDSLMVDRANIILENFGSVRGGTRNVLLDYYANVEGIDSALNFLNRLTGSVSSSSEKMDIEMHRIELLYDSSRTTEANTLLQQFKNTYDDNNRALEWAESISYDLEFLAPGSPFPPVGFHTITGDTLNTEDLTGRPFLFEITRFDNRLYQQQFDRTVAIHQIYRNFDLEIITMPIATSNVMLEAFFEERSLFWNVALPNSFNADELIEILNVNRVPTRFLVNRDGNIIRRYIGNEYDEVVRGLQQITTQTEQ